MAGDGVDFINFYPQPTTPQNLSVEQGIGYVFPFDYHAPAHLHRIDANLTTTILDSGLFPRPSTGHTTLDTFNVTARIATDGEFVYAMIFTHDFTNTHRPLYSQLLGPSDRALRCLAQRVRIHVDIPV
jgi:hypothetical protein